MPDDETVTAVALVRRRLAARTPVALDLNGWEPAAVLVLLYPKAGVEHIVFQIRTNTVEHHKGQTSFPGGAVHEADADLETTALRETYEEIGIDPANVEVLGRLDDMVTNSHFRVTPIVGLLHGGPHEFLLSPDEVAEVFEVPLPYLLDPANCGEDRRERSGATQILPVYEFQGRRIWGATARMLRGFLDLLGPESDQVKEEERSL